MFTEEEARKKWCPHVRAGYARDGHAINCSAVGLRIPGYALCIASECTAWRWVMIRSLTQGAQIERDGSLSWANGSHKPGYCGLAGEP